MNKSGTDKTEPNAHTSGSALCLKCRLNLEIKIESNLQPKKNQNLIIISSQRWYDHRCYENAE